MKFITLIPTCWNDGTPIPRAYLERAIRSVWQPFRGMTREDGVSGHWLDDDDTEFQDVCVKVTVSCDRSQLQQAIRGVLRAGKKLKQRAMWFEVDGYDGVQILRIP